MKNGLPSAFARTRSRRGSRAARSPISAPTSTCASVGGSGSNRSRVARHASRYSGRALARRSTRPVGADAANSTRKASLSASSQCRSSTTTTSGRSPLSRSHTRASASWSRRRLISGAICGATASVIPSSEARTAACLRARDRARAPVTFSAGSARRRRAGRDSSVGPARRSGGRRRVGRAAHTLHRGPARVASRGA